MPTGASNIFGGGGLKVGQFASGNLANDSDFLPCDGTEYLRSAYPQLDYTGLQTFGSNVWQSRTMPSAQNWHAVAFGNGIFVAINRSTSTSFASSTDGITWTARTVASGVYYSIIFAAGLFVAVGEGVCATSPDGITWANRTVTGTLSSVAYGNGLFVAVGGAGAFFASHTYADSQNYATSPDGLTWTMRSMPVAYSWTNVRFVGDRFIAPAGLSSAAYTNTTYASQDGINWVSVTNPVASAGYGYAYSWEEFKGRLYFLGQSDLLVSTQASNARGNYASVLNRGWSFAGSAVGISSYWCKTSEWLIEYASQSLFSITQDGETWRTIPAPTGVLNIANPSGAFAYGNGVLVLAHGNAAATIFTLSTDTTKFRMPKVRTYTEADRFYIKAK